MSETKIAWAEKVWNPITGCTKISAGCSRCYAERMAKRLSHIPASGYDPADPFKVTFHPDRLEQPLKWRKPARVFVCSMGDLFHEDVIAPEIDQVFATMREASQHTFLVLTKRSRRMCNYAASSWWPSNVRFGVSVENQATADMRIPHLREFENTLVSYEPALGPVDFSELRSSIDWLIIGGESGAGARPCRLAWLKSAVLTCQDAHVPAHCRLSTPVFVKQVGANPIGYDGKPYPVTGAGRDMSQWPEELRVQEYPEGM